MKKLIPETIENKIPNNKFVYYFCWLLVGFNLFRSLEHIFRAGIGQYKSLIISSAPPGALTPLIGFVTLIFFFISIRENK